jgi:hypothetical protein
VFALAWRNYSPRSITPPKVLWAFCVPLRLGANWGYWPSDSVFDQGGGVHHKLYSCFSLGWGLLLIATGIGTRYKEHRFYVSFEGRSHVYLNHTSFLNAVNFDHEHDINLVINVKSVQWSGHLGSIACRHPTPGTITWNIYWLFLFEVYLAWYQ